MPFVAKLPSRFLGWIGWGTDHCPLIFESGEVVYPSRGEPRNFSATSSCALSLIRQPIIALITSIFRPAAINFITYRAPRIRRAPMAPSPCRRNPYPSPSPRSKPNPKQTLWAFPQNARESRRHLSPKPQNFADAPPLNRPQPNPVVARDARRLRRAENIIADHPQPSPGNHRCRHPKGMGQTQRFFLHEKRYAPSPVGAIGKVPTNRLLMLVRPQ